jgi:serine/threonine-protein kinase RsbT
MGEAAREAMLIVEEQVEIRSERDVVFARKQGRDIASESGFDAVECAKVATVISELARNIILYAGSGEIVIKIEKTGAGRVVLEVVARDRGPGIEDVELVMRDGYSTSNGLGLGLPGTRRLMDDFELRSEVGQGTTVMVGKWLAR